MGSAQYYMSEINDRLETLTKSVDRIGDFQKREFKSHIRSLVAHVWKVSQFRSEIMEDDIQRNNTLLKLDHLEMRATDLLEQVNTEIEDITQQNHEPKYEDYQERISELAILRDYQAALLAVLGEIAELTYLLGRGSVSAERSRVLLGTYVGQSEQARAHLGEWHNCQVERLHIDLEQERRSKAGMDAVIAFVPSLIDGKFKYRQLGQGLAHEIGTQTNSVIESRGEVKEAYDEDVEIIIKDGKYFYLHESPASVAKHASGPPATNRNPPSASKKRVLWWQHPDDRSDMG